MQPVSKFLYQPDKNKAKTRLYEAKSNYPLGVIMPLLSVEYGANHFVA